MNKVFLLGRLTADPELRQTASNISVTSFTVAVNRPYTKGAERQADFIDVVAWRQSAEFVCRYFQKGKPILVEGRLQVRDYTDKNGNKRRVYEVQADNVSFVEGAGNGGNTGGASPSYNNSPSPSAAPEPSGVAYSSGDAGDFEEVGGFDDLPF
ncbi:MAG: single-stranded DNA-binding protein [Oscillospiraceae bacterium]|nr:single-stranded DNA-binding protein [Oscillospiraceae bacterium]MDY4191452.1 single-stranded DNA-binding protein [Oscillospiraceae bacterium]